jgi:hypothetical protein
VYCLERLYDRVEGLGSKLPCCKDRWPHKSIYWSSVEPSDLLSIPWRRGINVWVECPRKHEEDRSLKILGRVSKERYPRLHSPLENLLVELSTLRLAFRTNSACFSLHPSPNAFTFPSCCYERHDIANRRLRWCNVIPNWLILYPIISPYRHIGLAPLLHWTLYGTPCAPDNKQRLVLIWILSMVHDA